VGVFLAGKRERGNGGSRRNLKTDVHGSVGDALCRNGDAEVRICEEIDSAEGDKDSGGFGESASKVDVLYKGAVALALVQPPSLR